MDIPQESHFDSLLKRDTLGPLNFSRDSESDGSTGTGSSATELTRALDTGQRSSFRAITRQPMYVYENDVDLEETDVKTAAVHVHTPRVDVDTPDSVASTGRRTFFTQSGVRNLNTAVLQQNHMAKSMREHLKTREIDSRGFDEVFPEVSSNMEHTKVDTVQEKKVLCWPKVLAFVIVAAMMIAGLALLIYFKKNDSPSAQKGVIIDDHPDTTEERQSGICSKVEVKLREGIRFNCSLEKMKSKSEDLKSIKMQPPVYFNEGQAICINISEEATNHTWRAYTSNQFLFVEGPAATCSAGGKYLLVFQGEEQGIRFNASVNINVMSEVLKVNVSLTQKTNSTDGNFQLGCSTNSGCEQSFVDFFAEINKEEQFLRGVNFSCVITYNDYDGYSVSCVGNIPDFLMSQFEKITCRPRSRLLDDLHEDELMDLETEIELPECDLTKHCGYTCQSSGDYYVVSEARCDIFHRCYQKQVFTSYCAPGTFFDPAECACRHTRELPWCQDNGALRPEAASTINKEQCNT